MITLQEVLIWTAGSSSGSAVAVAARVAPFALCEDTGGNSKLALALHHRLLFDRSLKTFLYPQNCVKVAVALFGTLSLQREGLHSQVQHSVNCQFTTAVAVT